MHLPRLEKKYLLSPNQAASALAFCEHSLRPDTFSTTNPYEVHSIYYDTNSLETFHQKKEGLRRKQKYRLRWYENSFGKYAFFEIKYKVRDISYKHRQKVNWPNSGLIPDFLAPANFMSRNINSPLSPIIHISYLRRAFQTDSLRLNFDTRINCELIGSNYLLKKDLPSTFNSNSIGSYSIFEMKTASRQDLLDIENLLPFLKEDKREFSKYTFCLERLQNGGTDQLFYY